jgi:hypothetical protein
MCISLSVCLPLSIYSRLYTSAYLCGILFAIIFLLYGTRNEYFQAHNFSLAVYNVKV